MIYSYDMCDRYSYLLPTYLLNTMTFKMRKSEARIIKINNSVRYNYAVIRIPYPIQPCRVREAIMCVRNIMLSQKKCYLSHMKFASMALSSRSQDMVHGLAFSRKFAAGFRHEV
jgi:hypothetical protein